jgi:hypothetical protein
MKGGNMSGIQIVLSMSLLLLFTMYIKPSEAGEEDKEGQIVFKGLKRLDEPEVTGIELAFELGKAFVEKKEDGYMFDIDSYIKRYGKTEKIFYYELKKLAESDIIMPLPVGSEVTVQFRGEKFKVGVFSPDFWKFVSQVLFQYFIPSQKEEWMVSCMWMPRSRGELLAICYDVEEILGYPEKRDAGIKPAPIKPGKGDPSIAQGESRSDLVVKYLVSGNHPLQQAALFVIGTRKIILEEPLEEEQAKLLGFIKDKEKGYLVWYAVRSADKKMAKWPMIIYNIKTRQLTRPNKM